MKPATLGAWAGLLLLAACFSGLTPERHPLIRHATADSCGIEFKNRSAQSRWGELLALEDSAALLLVRDSVWLMPYETADRIWCNRSGFVPFDERSGARRLDRERAAPAVRLSRFPQGSNPQLLAALLSAYRQDTLYVMRR